MLIRTQAVLDDPSVRTWVKDSIRLLLDRDLCDAVADAELVLTTLRRELRAAQSKPITATDTHTMCLSGWTGDRCTLPLGHPGPHSNP